MSNPNPYDITLPDVSPMLVYAPQRDGESPTTGWKLSYDGSPDASYDITHKTDNEGKGTSSHWSSMNGASVSLDFWGTGVTVYGSSSPGAFVTSIDSKDTPGAPKDAKLFATESLPLGKHTMSLKLSDGGGGLNLTSVVVKGAVGPSGATVIPKTEDAVKVASDGTGVSSDFYKTSGSAWSNLHSIEKYPRIDTNAVGGLASFTVSNASGVVVYGTSNYDHQTYSVSVNPPVGASTEERTFNATSRWFSYNNVVFFETGMNPNTTYNVQFKNLAVNSYFDIHSSSLLETVGGSNSTAPGAGSTPDSSSSKGGLSTGAIAGIAVGAAIVTLLAIISALLWKKKQRAASARLSRQEINGEVKTTPFAYDQGSHMSPGYASHGPSSLYTSTPAPYPPSPNHTLSYTSSPAPQDSRQYLNEYGAHPSNSQGAFTAPSPYQMQSANNSGSGFAGVGMIPPTKWSQNNPGMPNPHDSPQPGSSVGYAGSSSAGGSEAAYNSSPGQQPRQTNEKNPATLTAARPAPRQEVDAGPAAVPAEEPEAETLPPGYNPQWSGGS